MWVRIVEVITGGEVGGAQRHVVELTTFLVSQGHQVTLVHGGGRWIDSVVPESVHKIYCSRLVRDVNVRVDFGAVVTLMALLRDATPDVVHCHSSKAGILGRIAAWRLHIPSVYTAHGYVFQDPTRSRSNRAVFRVIEAWAAKRSTAIITMTDDDSRFAQRYLPSTAVHQIVNGVLAREQLRQHAHSPQRIGFLGRFSPEKGLPDLLAVAARQSEWHWIIAGDGEMRDIVQSYTSRYPHISWIGWVDDIDAFFDDIDVLVQPSYKEGAPYTVLDAFACGVPVVGTAVGSMTEMIHRVDRALLYEPGNKEAFMRAIDYALDHRERLVEQCQRVQRQFYALSDQLHRTESVLQAAVLS